MFNFDHFEHTTMGGLTTPPWKRESQEDDADKSGCSSSLFDGVVFELPSPARGRCLDDYHAESGKSPYSSSGNNHKRWQDSFRSRKSETADAGARDEELFPVLWGSPVSPSFSDSEDEELTGEDVEWFALQAPPDMISSPMESSTWGPPGYLGVSSFHGDWVSCPPIDYDVDDDGWVGDAEGLY